MEFEFDQAKSEINLRKHGIDFEAAQVLWDDPSALEVPVLSSTEPRYLLIGRMGRKHWSAVFTYRDGRIRLISVRRSRDKEIESYEKSHD